MIKLILFGGVIHLFFLASIFVIYFQSPIIVGLKSQNKIVNPPAKRLVLFLADGLRAESLFRDGCGYTKFIQNIILTQGIHGISHTRVPTESRTGHVALTAGMYEDPSALLKGWQENPVNFDSVFNRSRITYAWGSPDILTLFKKRTKNFKAFAYDSSIQDFSGRYSTIVLDTWVFENIERFLKEHHEQLQTENETIFFCHLLGLDSAGHVHKPNSRLFNDNLVAVDQGVERVSTLFNSLFEDNRTAFIFTADHGMTDRGSHGDGDKYETETPIVAWGAGINKNAISFTTSLDLVNKIGPAAVPRFDVQQIDIAPLMSSLLGIAVPVNNYGQLPYEYLNASNIYVATAMFHNALQIAEQYKHLRNEFADGALSKYLNDYHFNGNDMSTTEIKIHQLLHSGKFDDVIHASKHLMEQSLNGIEYFQSYYQYWLLGAVSLSMIGWILYLSQESNLGSEMNSYNKFKICKSYSFVATFGLIVILVFMQFQNLPLSNAIVFFGPLLCWIPVSCSFILTLIKNVKTWMFILAVESLLCAFFYRWILCVHLVLLPIYYLIRADNRRLFGSNYTKWILTCVLLSTFPLLPIVGKNDKNSTEILIFGIILWTIKLCYSLQQNYSNYSIFQLIIFIVASVNLVAIEFGSQLGIVLQIISWICLSLSFTLPLLQPTKHRFSKIIDGTSIAYLLLSLSYEPIFLLVLSLNLEYLVEMQCKEGKQFIINVRDCQKIRTYPNAFSFMLYVLLSFFGTGNLASISSFDPNSVRCFVAVFSPLIMAALIILKIIIPLILVVCAFTAIYESYKLPMDKIFIAILIICNLMGLNFLFLVTNKGSWLQIGTSISHFIIIEATTVILCVLQIFTKFLMKSKFSFPLMKRSVSVYKFE